MSWNFLMACLGVKEERGKILGAAQNLPMGVLRKYCVLQLSLWAMNLDMLGLCCQEIGEPAGVQNLAVFEACSESQRLDPILLHISPKVKGYLKCCPCRRVQQQLSTENQTKAIQLMVGPLPSPSLLSSHRLCLPWKHSCRIVQQ